MKKLQIRRHIMKNLLIILLSSLFLIGCSGTKVLDIFAEPAPIVIQHPPPPRALTMFKVEWRVLNAAILKEMLENGDDVQFIALTPAGYENLALNFGEIKRYIKQQKQVIIYYQKLTDGAEVETKEGKKWKLKDLIPGEESSPDISLLNLPLGDLNYLPSTDRPYPLWQSGPTR